MRFLVVIAFLLLLVSNCTSYATAKLVTFAYEAELTQSLGDFLPLPLGQRVRGSYTFEIDPTATAPAGGTSVTFHKNVITDFNVEIVGIGTGGGSSGDILLGDPVLTTGDVEFLSDLYEVQAQVTGITIPTRFGDRSLVGAIIRMQDIDQVGIDSENLSETPPDLSLFLDNPRPTLDTDKANILLVFVFSDGFGNANEFQLTSLRVIPEPSTAALLATCCIVPSMVRRRT